jgi:hypothetical protein
LFVIVNGPLSSVADAEFNQAVIAAALSAPHSISSGAGALHVGGWFITNVTVNVPSQVAPQSSVHVTVTSIVSLCVGV